MPAAARHDPPVCAAGEHTAAGNGMAVDRRHHWFRMKEHCLVHATQCREKPADVIGAACAHLQKVHAGRKDVPLPGQHHRACVGGTQLVEAVGQALAQGNVERIGLAVPYGDGRDRIFGLHIDHGRCLAGVL
jgi:hypothetical protein